MSQKKVLEHIKNIKDLAIETGLDFYPTIFEFVDNTIMLEACSYGLPVRARHWTYGKAYQQQKLWGSMGMSKVYEIVFNNDPAYAFLMNTNTDVVNIMVGAHVYGHCIKHDQLVETDDGVKAISDIKIGDSVLTHTGNFKKVLEARETTRTTEVYNITAYGSQPIECTSDHRFYIDRDGEAQWVMAKELLKTDKMIVPRIKAKNIKNTLNIPIIVSRTTPLRKKAMVSTGYNFKLDYDFGRVVGFYLAEGSIGSGNRFCFSFSKSEMKYANFIKAYFDNYGINTSIRERKLEYAIDVYCFDKSVAVWFEDNFGHGCDKKHIPKELLDSANFDFYSGLVRGYFEGDGWIADGFTGASAVSISRKLAHQIKNLCATLGVKIGLKPRNRPNRKRTYDMTVTGINYERVLDLCGIKRTNVPSRRWCFSKIEDDYILTKIRKISVEKHNNPISMWDLEVEDDHSFVLANGACAHNCDFFKHNIAFQGSDRSMIYRAAERATRVDQYIEQYGMDKVEHLMDIGMALCRHIDWSKGIYRDKYPKRKIVNVVKKKGEFDDLLGGSGRSVKQKIIGDKLPPKPERDLLWFLINYAPLEDWERDVLGILREESYYFWPIITTKIGNEGHASFFHAELMYKYKHLSEGDYMDFAKVHAGVVNPGHPFRINPYYLGFKILTDIREKWDKYYEAGESKITGIQKILQVSHEEDDASLLRNYLTKELATDLGLFNFGYRHERGPDATPENLTEEHGIIELKDRELNKIIDNIIRPTVNYGAPLIKIIDTDGDTLVMRHEDNFGPLDKKYAEKTMEYIYELWGGPVELETYNYDKDKVVYSLDETGLDVI